MSEFRVNALCFIGAVIGVIAIFSVWMSSIFILWYRDWNLFNVVSDLNSSTRFWLPALLFILGTVVAFISPLGGLAQVAGICIWFSDTVAFADKLPSKIGPYLGIISAVIVLVSAVKPVGLGYQSKPTGALGRLLTISMVGVKGETKGV